MEDGQDIGWVRGMLSAIILGALAVGIVVGLWVFTAVSFFVQRPHMTKGYDLLGLDMAMPGIAVLVLCALVCACAMFFRSVLAAMDDSKKVSSDA